MSAREGPILNFIKTRAGRGALLALAYLLIALVMTWPLMLHFGSHYVAGVEDGAMSIWNLWWMKYSLMDLGQSPLSSQHLFYPDGVSLTFHSLPKVLGILSIPLQYLTGIVFTYNVIFILTTVLTALATYLLVVHLLGQRLPAFLAGALFAFSPPRLDHLSHLQLLSTALIPLYILLIIKGREAIEKGEKLSWILFSLAGITLAVTAYDTEYYAAYLIIFSAFYFAFYVPPGWNLHELRKWGKLCLGLIVSGAVFLALFLPMLLAAKQELVETGNYVSFPSSKSRYYAADLLSFFLPGPFSEYLGASFESVTRKNLYTTDTVFVGIIALLLSFAGLWYYRRRRDAWLWAFTALIFGSLAFGTRLIVHGEVKNILAPYALLAKTPVFDSLRVPARFGIMVMFAVALLAGYGAGALFGILRKRGWGTVAVPAAAVLIFFGMYIEFKPFAQMTSGVPPAVYTEIASSTIPGAVITMPLGWEGGADTAGLENTYTQLFQMEHHRPMVGGMLARVPKENIFEGAYTPVLDFLADPVDLEPSDLDRDPEAIARFEERYRVAFIVAHKSEPETYFDGTFQRYPSELTPDVLKKVDEYVTAYLDMEKFAETEEIVAYRRR